MTLFKKAEPEAAFLKLGFYGSNGAGKTHTASLVAIGLHKHLKSKKPIYFLDSETGSDYVLPLFKKHKVELLVAKTRAFSDLLKAVDEAEKNGFMLLTDSISHYWDELCTSYAKEKDVSRLTIRHWQEIKPIWREFSEKFVMSNLHIIVCGRAGDVWEEVQDEDGAKELRKTGTKMRVEKELGYEPSLLVEMVKERTANGNGKGWAHRAHVVKDRFDVIDSDFFDDPNFETFLPHIELLNLGGAHKALEADRTSNELFKGKNNNGYQRMRQREKVLDKISNAIWMLHPKQNADDKKARLELQQKIFNTISWEVVKDLSIDLLEAGWKVLEKLIEEEQSPEPKEAPAPPKEKAQEKRSAA